MDAFYIKGGKELNGEINLYSAKNALLPILAASIICTEDVTILNCCKFSDVQFMIKILENLGVESAFEGNDLILKLGNANQYTVSEEFTKKVRSSIFMLGSLLSRFRHAKVAYPGGCNIGTRPIDLHLKGLKALNVQIREEEGVIICDGTNMKSGTIVFDFPSVGATENVMMASVLLPGKTVIHNPAKEPEIVDLQNFLNAMGAKVKGAGTKTIVVEGVSKLHGTVYKPISDRIVTGTYLLACAACGGKVKLNNANPKHNLALLKMLKESGCKLKTTPNSITITANKTHKSIKWVETKPYPGFATDLQSPFLTYQTTGKGVSTIVENLYETRFKIVPELLKMGANIAIKDRTAVVTGVKELTGAKVTATDLRSGAGLVIAGLAANGETVITEIENIERGYQNMDADLRALGANITRISLEANLEPILQK